MLFSHFPSFLVLAAALLLTTAGCTKKGDPIIAPRTGTSSYQFNSHQLSNGQTTNRQVTGEAHSLSSTDNGYDFLEIQLITTPQPASGAETLKLYFSKQIGQPATAYQLDDTILYGNSNFQVATFSNEVATLVQASDGSFSGTFSGTFTTLAGFIYQVDYALTAGTFTNAHP